MIVCCCPQCNARYQAKLKAAVEQITANVRERLLREMERPR